MFYNLLNLKRKTVKEQLDLEELKPSADSVSRLKKQLTYAEKQEAEYLKKVAELEAELAEILTPVEVSYIGKGFEAISADISKLFEKRTDRTEEQVKTELKLYGIWYRSKLGTDLNKMINEDMKQVVQEQKDKLKSIEETFETGKNGAEIDELLPIIKGELPSIAQRMYNLGDTLLDTDKYSVTERGNKMYRDLDSHYFGYTNEEGVEKMLYFNGGASAYRGIGWMAMPKRNSKEVE